MEINMNMSPMRRSRLNRQNSPLFQSPFFQSPFFRALDTDLESLFRGPQYEVERTPEGYVYEFNLAGFEREEITLKLDQGRNSLLVVGRRRHRGELIETAYTVLLEGRHTDPGDINSSLRNGLLRVVVKHAASVDIPVAEEDDTAGAGAEIPTTSVPLTTEK